MSTKRRSLRFNLENMEELRAWEYLESYRGSKNSAVISAINSYFEPKDDLKETIRETIRECLKDISVAPIKTEVLSEEENDLLDSVDMFLGN
ncbi:MAG: plasmid segregation centromere-binding protein ParR [Oscillospiraceae bacterium]|nr:plasmid segregation centromere-binding protein ParR [Oscillospiraceae bacterium]